MQLCQKKFFWEGEGGAEEIGILLPAGQTVTLGYGIFCLGTLFTIVSNGLCSQLSKLCISWVIVITNNAMKTAYQTHLLNFSCFDVIMLYSLKCTKRLFSIKKYIKSSNPKTHMNNIWMIESWYITFLFLLFWLLKRHLIFITVLCCIESSMN